MAGHRCRAALALREVLPRQQPEPFRFDVRDDRLRRLHRRIQPGPGVGVWRRPGGPPHPTPPPQPARHPWGGCLGPARRGGASQPKTTHCHCSADTTAIWCRGVAVDHASVAKPFFLQKKRHNGRATSPAFSGYGTCPTTPPQSDAIFSDAMVSQIWKRMRGFISLVFCIFQKSLSLAQKW